MSETGEIQLNVVSLSFEAQEAISAYLFEKEHLGQSDVVLEAIKKAWELGGKIPIIYKTYDGKLELVIHFYIDTLKGMLAYTSRYDVVIQVPKNDTGDLTGFIDYSEKLDKLSFKI